MNKKNDLKLIQDNDAQFNAEVEMERFANLVEALEQQLDVPPELDAAVKAAARQKRFRFNHWRRRIGFTLGTIGSIAAAWAVILVIDAPQKSLVGRLPGEVNVTTAAVDWDEVDLLLQQQQVFSEEMKIAIMIDDYLINPNLK